MSGSSLAAIRNGIAMLQKKNGNDPQFLVVCSEDEIPPGFNGRVIILGEMFRNV